MQVTICGPNLNDQSKGQFHVHAAGCSDLRRHARREPEYKHGWTIDVESRLDVASEVYADHMDENPEDSPWSKPEAYLEEFHFFPCVDGLV